MRAKFSQIMPLAAICISFILNNLAIKECRAEEISGGILGKVLCVESIDGLDIVYVGTESGLYKSDNTGKSWEELGASRNISSIKRIAVSNERTFVAAGNGIYSTSDGSNWEWLTGKLHVEGIFAAPEKAGHKDIFAWSEKELFRVTGETLDQMASGARWDRIDDVVTCNGSIFVASDKNMFRSSDRGETWDKIFLVDGSEETGQTDEAEENGESEENFPVIKNIDSFGEKGVVAATTRGIFVIEEKNLSVEKIDAIGLPQSDLSYTTHAGEYFFAATSDKVFRYDPKERSWRLFFEKTFPGDISFLKAHKDSGGTSWLLIAGGRYLYRQKIDFFPEENEMFGDVEGSLKDKTEIPVQEVQKLAIEYAEVNPEKIKSWRAGAKLKALLPKVSMDFSESRDDNVEIYTNSTMSYTAVGPRKKGSDWGLGVSWDLSDLIWSEAQTSIDVRSKLMVQLRNDILEEVTRLYFERERLLMEIGRLRETGTDDPNILLAKTIRVEELTAYIDGFTGGQFSSALKVKK